MAVGAVGRKPLSAKFPIANEAGLKETGARLAEYVAGQREEPAVMLLSDKRKTGGD